MGKGYIKLFRHLLDNKMWLSEPFTRGQAWVDMLLLANHKDGYIRKRGVRVTVLRGQLGWSERALSDRWKWSRGKVRRFLNELKKDGNIEPQKSNITSLINIINYEFYQGDSTTSDTTDGPQTDHKQYQNKNDKNDKNGKKKEKIDKKESRTVIFKPPTREEISSFCNQQNLKIDIDVFLDHYKGNGWMIGKTKMKDWKATVRNWARRDKEKNNKPEAKARDFRQEYNIQSAKAFLERGAL